MGKDWAYAIGKIEGGFTELYIRPGDPEYAQAKAETDATISWLTPQTAQDVRNYGKALWDSGYYLFGDTQGMVRPDGRWQPIDFSSVKQLPSDPVEALKLEKRHESEVDGLAKMYEKQMADRDAAKAGAGTP
jgi:hypothetical protein